MFRWLGILLLSLLCTSVVHAKTASSIVLQTYRPQHPEFQWLQRFLRLRGFQVKASRSSSNSLTLRLMTGSQVMVSQGQHTRRFQIPQRLTSPQTRARICALYVDMFLETLRRPASKKPSVEPAAPSKKRTKPVAKARRVRLAQKARSTVSPRRRRLRMRRTRRVVKSMVARRPPNVRRAPVARPTLPISPKPAWRKTVATPQRRKRSVKVASFPPGRRQKVKTKAVALARPQVVPPTTPTKLASALPRTRRTAPRVRKLPKKRKPQKRVAMGVIQKPVAPSRKQRLWGDILSLDLGVSGGFRFASVNPLQGGGSVLLGFNIWRWSLRFDLNVHSYYLTQQERNILLMRPTFWLGFQIPLGRAESWLRLQVLGGLSSEFWVKQTEKDYSTGLHWGPAVGLQLSAWFAQRWSVFLRPMVQLYPYGFSVENRDNEFSASPVQWSMMVGLQVRL